MGWQTAFIVVVVRMCAWKNTRICARKHLSTLTGFVGQTLTILPNKYLIDCFFSTISLAAIVALVDSFGGYAVVGV
jgi:uncharacterized membrane protein